VLRKWNFKNCVIFCSESAKSKKVFALVEKNVNTVFSYPAEQPDNTLVRFTGPAVIFSLVDKILGVSEHKERSEPKSEIPFQLPGLQGANFLLVCDPSIISYVGNIGCKFVFFFYKFISLLGSWKCCMSCVRLQ